jgi:hypothetical protein
MDRCHRKGSNTTSRTCQRRAAALMASSTSTMGTRQSLLPSGASHKATSSTWRGSTTVVATTAVQSRE